MTHKDHVSRCYSDGNYGIGDDGDYGGSDYGSSYRRSNDHRYEGNGSFCISRYCGCVMVMVVVVAKERKVFIDGEEVMVFCNIDFKMI